MQLTAGAPGAAAALASSTRSWTQPWHPNLRNRLALHPRGRWESPTAFLLLLLLIINKFFVGAFYLSSASCIRLHTALDYTRGLRKSCCLRDGEATGTEKPGGMRWSPHQPQALLPSPCTAGSPFLTAQEQIALDTVSSSYFPCEIPLFMMRG